MMGGGLHLSHLSCCCGKLACCCGMMLFKGEFNLAPSLRTRLITATGVGGSRSRHICSQTAEQRGMMFSWVLHSIWSRSPAHEMVPPTLRVSFPTSVKPEIPPRHAQRFLSPIILDPALLTVFTRGRLDSERKSKRRDEKRRKIIGGR